MLNLLHKAALHTRNNLKWESVVPHMETHKESKLNILKTISKSQSNLPKF
jgi:hypothetical protein